MATMFCPFCSDMPFGVCFFCTQWLAPKEKKEAEEPKKQEKEKEK